MNKTEKASLSTRLLLFLEDVKHLFSLSEEELKNYHKIRFYMREEAIPARCENLVEEILTDRMKTIFLDVFGEK